MESWLSWSKAAACEAVIPEISGVEGPNPSLIMKGQGENALGLFRLRDIIEKEVMLATE